MSNPRVLASTAGALRVLELRQQVAAHNLANVSSPGFKADRVFARADVEGGAPVADRGRNEADGPLVVTNRPLDLALEGDGFLVVTTPEGQRLTRGGSLGIDPDGGLVDASGHPVMGVDGENIVLPPGELVVSRTGDLQVEGIAAGRLLLVRVEGAEGLLMAGAGGLRIPPEGLELQEALGIRVHQGALEDSNVNPVLAMTDMIEIQRSYASLQRSVHVLDGVMDRVANSLGRLT
ncbi:MAG: flagellar hook basal-body protein [Gemmatimonadales bacterium]|nr:MAG: flagellar hook basal-body protein [Gemmatimonadales bacterium]